MVVIPISERARVVGGDRSRLEKGRRVLEVPGGRGGADEEEASGGLDLGFEGVGLERFASGCSSISSVSSSSADLEVTAVGSESFFLCRVLFFLLLDATPVVDILLSG
jgi:hypothetical protein